MWIDFWTEVAHPGPGWIEVAAPLDTLPLFVPQGAIIPCGPNVQYSWERPVEPLTIEIYRGADRFFTLYEDDGETSAYQSGASAETRIEIIEGADAFTCRIGETRGKFAAAKAERTVMMKIHRQPPVRTVSCDGASLDALPSIASIEAAQGGWWWDEARQLLTIKLRRQMQSLTVRVA